MILLSDFAVPCAPRRLGHDTASFFLSVFAVVAAGFLGYGAAALLLPSETGFLLASADPYAGCALPAEFAVRGAELCRPILLQTALVWISAYVDFEKPMLIALFSWRGLSLGASLYAVLRLTQASALSFLPLAYAAIIAVHLILTRCLRRETGRVPLSESCIYALIAGGVASAILLAASLMSV